MIRRAYEIYRTEGPGELGKRALRFGYNRIRPTVGYDVVLFELRDWLDRSQRGDVMVTTRLSTIGSDPLALLIDIHRVFDDPTVYLAVESRSDFRETEPLTLDQFDADIRLIERDSEVFDIALRRCGLVFSMWQDHVENYRKLQKNDNRVCVRIHHGIMTKAYGNLERAKIDRRTPHEDELEQYPDGFDVQSVASDVELFYRACAEGRHPVAFRKYGYPRFDRINRLRKGTATPVVPPETREALANGSDAFKILYAPTHKDEDTTALFPLSDFEPERLRSFLQDSGMELYIRMHPLEEDLGIYQEFIDGKTVRYAGRDFSSAVCEILPYFDALVTDYSSIYVDYLPFDRPIIFVQDNYDEYSEKRGLAFDYDLYFPGPKATSLEEFIQYLQKSKRMDDWFDDERAFVRKTFLPELNRTFLKSVVAEFRERLEVPGEYRSESISTTPE